MFNFVTGGLSTYLCRSYYQHIRSYYLQMQVLVPTYVGLSTNLCRSYYPSMYVGLTTNLSRSFHLPVQVLLPTYVPRSYYQPIQVLLLTCVGLATNLCTQVLLPTLEPTDGRNKRIHSALTKNCPKTKLPGPSIELKNWPN